MDERILDLLAFLLVARRPVPLKRVFEELGAHYAASPDARERMFSRDKELLRTLGVPLVFVPPADEDEEGGYVVDHAQAFMPEISLTPEEQALLYAVGAAAQSSAFPMRQELARALTKLAASTVDDQAARPVVAARPTRRPAFEKMMADAVLSRRRLRLRYPPETEERVVEPYAFKSRAGRYFLVGYCHLRGGIRTFASDRVSACRFDNTSSTTAQFTPPDGFDATPHLPVHPWQVRVHEPIEVELQFDPNDADSASRLLGVPAEGVVSVTNLEGLAAQMLSFGTGVRIVRPLRLRQVLAKMLDDLLEAHGGAT